MVKGRTTVEVGPDGIALITIINPPVNSLSFDVLASLKENLDEALRRNDVKAIVITGAKGKFSGGFDITAFSKIQGADAGERPKPGQIAMEIMSDTLEAATKPSVAAIDGLALGGGLELAMACHARISTPNAQLGLPELQLGIIPGFGGTQRLPRLVGLPKALEVMLTSKPVKAEEASKLGLVDALVSADLLVSTARRWALDILERRRPWVASLYKTDKLPPLGEAREMLKFARAQAKKRAPNLHHPLACLDAVEEGIVSGPRAGLLKIYKMSSATVSSPKKTKQNGVITKWDDDNSGVLLEVLEHEIALGNRPSGVLSKTGWFNIVQNFKTRTSLDYNKDQLKNRLDNLRREFVKWDRLIAKETRLGWDNQKRTLAAPESWWYERAKIDPGILKYKDGGPAHLEVMQRVFAGIAATGKYAYNPFAADTDPLLDSCGRLEQLNDIIDFTADNDVDLTNPITANVAASPPSTTVTPSSSNLRTHKRKRESSSGRMSEVDKYSLTVDSLTDTIRDSMNVYVKAKSTDLEATSYANVIDVLLTVPGMDTSNPLFMKAVRILEDKMRRVAFYAMVNLGVEAVMKWLSTFPDI